MLYGGLTAEDQSVVNSLVGAGSALAVVVGGVWVGVKWFAGWLEDRRNKKRKDAIEDEARTKDYWKDIVTRLDAQNQKLQGDNDACHKRTGRLGQAIVYLYGLAREAYQRQGGNPSDMKDLSEFLDDPDALAFVHNNTKQGTVLLHEEAQSIINPTQPGGGKTP